MHFDNINRLSHTYKTCSPKIVTCSCLLSKKHGTDIAGGTVSRVAKFKVCVGQQTNIPATPQSPLGLVDIYVVTKSQMLWHELTRGNNQQLYRVQPI